MLSCSLALLWQREVCLGEAGALSGRKSRRVVVTRILLSARLYTIVSQGLEELGTVCFPLQLPPLSLAACVVSQFLLS